MAQRAIFIGLFLVVACTAAAGTGDQSTMEGTEVLARAQGASAAREWTQATVLDLDRAVFHRLANGALERIAIPVEGRLVVFESSRFIARQGTATWAGGEAGGGAEVLLTLGEDHLFGRVTRDDRVIKLEPTREPYKVHAFELDPVFEEPMIGDGIPAASDGAPAEAPAAPRRSDDGSMIDMMVLYTDGLAADYPGAQIMTKIQSLIDLTNQCYTVSGINSQVQLVHSAQVTYPDDTGTMNVALYALTDNTGVFSNIEADRTTYGADQVTLLRKYVNEGCGLAWVLTSDNPRSAYSVVHSGSKPTGYYCSDHSFPHELGHNQGCAHDPLNASVNGRFTDSYGHQATDGSYRTVMAYSSGCPSGGPCTRTDYFSNPAKHFLNGLPTGILNERNNVRTVNITRVEMAGYRTHVETGLIFSDGFETGNMTGWSSAVP